MGGKKKKKRQETSSISSSSSLRSSSYRRDSGSPATSTANVGCMSGIFHLMSKYHTRRKFLTFGKKQERNAIVHAPKSPPQEKTVKTPPPISEDTIKCQQHEQGLSVGRFSLDQTPRIPAIPAEIRRSSTDSSVSSPRVVARLMGLDEFPATSPAPARVVSPAAEKRRKLLGALEKCDEDLQALKKIIEAVRATQTPPRVVEMKRREEVEEVESEVGSDEPSPVSVLDHHHLSSGYYYQRTTPNNDQIMQQHKPKQQKQQMTRKKPGDHEDKAIKPSLSIVHTTTTPQPLHLPARTTQQLLSAAATTAAATAAPWSTAMKESVFEVCRDIERGQRQEVGRIGLLLQDLILREMIDEIIKEMDSCFHVYSTSSVILPFEACKRQLSF